MKIKESEVASMAFARVLNIKVQARCLAALLVLGAVALGGCGSSSHSTSSSSPSGSSPVIVGGQTNSLPSPPAQSTVNRYAGIDLTSGNGASWNWRISHPDQSYNYQQQEGVNSAGGNNTSGGTFTPFGDFEYLTDNTNAPFTFSGFNTEINSGVSIFQPAGGGFPSTALAVGVLQQQTGCLAPNGSVTIDFLVVPSNRLAPYVAATDALYGYGSLGYKDGVFTYSNFSQFAAGGSNASTQIVPLADSYCIQALSGYGLQSRPTKGPGGTGTLLAYIGASGFWVGEVTQTSTLSTVSTAVGVVGIVQTKNAIDLSAVTSNSYKGFYSQDSPSSSYADPAYFGSNSSWVVAPVFSQTGSSLIGGFGDFNTLFFSNPAPQVTGNILIDFGAQNSSHPGLYASATIKEPDPSNLCKASQQSIGSDGQTYCTFPVVALIAESYAKYVIYVAGQEPTTGAPLFYALVQD